MPSWGQNQNPQDLYSSWWPPDGLQRGMGGDGGTAPGLMLWSEHWYLQELHCVSLLKAVFAGALSQEEWFPGVSSGPKAAASLSSSLTWEHHSTPTSSAEERTILATFTVGWAAAAHLACSMWVMQAVRCPGAFAEDCPQFGLELHAHGIINMPCSYWKHLG